ncbi:hypothetical protein [Actinomycetospora cinnamomea]|uniref:Uncharacterized protein n=1 Tax=Actinomycetospora cinnamomea TaxID=663609 RepID=A0A2U1FCK8_9PSEU|nr:hypothetical protein [Actinomycetospora cinnamomea]PVZ09931.1 hypothetical protein C8D89_1054 [Actinomycetospora cinnamomea]
MIEKYNPWTVVNVVFRHLAEQGLHPVLGESGDPSAAASQLLEALGITPGDPSWGEGQDAERVRNDLAALREAFEADESTSSRDR